jgi:polyvinyl alcohol dehydrogenase (cytochrome)
MTWWWATVGCTDQPRDGKPPDDHTSVIQHTGVGAHTGTTGSHTGSVPPPAVDWPRYGSDLAASRSSPETVLDASNVGALEEKWRLELPGCTSTPTVVAGVVYVADWDGTVWALRAADGSVVWSRPTGVTIDGSLAVEDGLVYFANAEGFVRALDATDGRPVWARKGDRHRRTHLWSSPIRFEDQVVVGLASDELTLPKFDYTFRGGVLSVDATTGDQRWKTYFTPDDATAGAGVSVWSSASIDVARRRMYIGTGQAYEAPAGPLTDALVALDLDTGAVVWSRQFTIDDVFTLWNDSGPDFDIGATPNLFTAGGRDLVAVGDKGGVIAAMDAETGETVWGPVRLSDGSEVGGVMGSAAYADGVLYAVSHEFRGGGSIDAPSPKDVHWVVALDAATGDVVWREQRPFPTVGGVMTVNGLVFNMSSDGTIYALDARDGRELWSDSTMSVAASGASTSGGRVFACSGFWFFKSEDEPDTVLGGLQAWGLPDE